MIGCEHWEQVLMAKQKNSRFEDGMKINVRVHNYPESMIALKNLKAAYIGNAILSLLTVYFELK